MLYLYALRLLLLIAIAVVYAIYDVYNKRNVPELFAYTSLAIGVLLTLTYKLEVMIFSGLIAILILAIGYVLYRIGQLGLGDTFEFAAISLILPIQPQALLVHASQFGMPFIISVFIATGICALIFVPIYYLFFAAKSPLEKKSQVSASSAAKGTLLFMAYMLLFAYITYYFGFRWHGLVLILLIAVPSAFMGAFEGIINMRMIKFVRPNELDDGDIIALNMMSKADASYMKRRAKHFGRLATKELIAELRGSRKKIPVYKAAVPLALFTLMGVLISVLFGDIILLLIS